jgi:YbbR domain-containing protein
MEGEGQMNDLLKKDIVIKIVSVLLAILLWLYVLNIDNPYKNKPLTIPIKVENINTLQEKALALKNDNFTRNVEVIIRGREEVLNKISPGDFQAILDFSKVKSVDDKTLKIDFIYDIDDITITVMIPRSVNIELEKIEKKAFPLQVELTGQPKENYKIINMTQVPESVTLEDVESVINQVASVKSFIDISNLDDDKTVKQECKVYDKNGKEITKLSKNLSVEVKLEVAKEVPVNLVVTGKPAQDYLEGAKKISPEKVLIAGPKEIVSGITGLKTEPVSIENSRENVSTKTAISLPEGVRLVNSPKEVLVNITIESLVNKNFTIAKDDIAILNFSAEELLDFEIVTESVEITLKGKQADLQNISAARMKPSIDVGGLEEGTHSIPLNIELPAGVRLLEKRNIEVKINKALEQ